MEHDSKVTPLFFFFLFTDPNTDVSKYRNYFFLIVPFNKSDAGYSISLLVVASAINFIAGLQSENKDSIQNQI